MFAIICTVLTCDELTRPGQVMFSEASTQLPGILLLRSRVVEQARRGAGVHLSGILMA